MKVQPEKGASSHSLVPLFDRDEIRRALRALALPGEVTELRILSAQTKEFSRSTYQASGYFDNPESLLKALAGLHSAMGVYVTLQPCNPALLARAHNRLRSANEMGQKASATSDGQITQMRWLLIDLDPERPAGISSTNEEHQAALDLAQHIKDNLQKRGWPDPLVADSGNGAHLLYQVDLPVSEGAKETGNCLAPPSHVPSSVCSDQPRCRATGIIRGNCHASASFDTHILFFWALFYYLFPRLPIS